MESKPQFNKDQMTQEELSAWVEKKQDQRETVNALADRQLADVFSDPQELNAHLKRQATFGKMGVTNVLLIGAQNVEATHIRGVERARAVHRKRRKGDRHPLSKGRVHPRRRNDPSELRDQKRVRCVSNPRQRLSQPILPACKSGYQSNAHQSPNPNRLER